MGEIHLEEMEFYSYHGHFKEERIVGNKFLVDLMLETDMRIPSESDSLEDALNYQEAYMIVKREMSKKSHLLENIAGRIVESVCNELPGIIHATVKIRKMNPPVGGKMRAVSVTLRR